MGTWWRAVIACGVLTAGPELALAQEPAMVIEARNMAAVPGPVLGDAALRVTTIYQAAGIAVSWVDEPIIERSGPPILTVIIAHGTTKKNVDPESFGLAPERAEGCGHVAYVFWDRIAQYARDHRVDAPVVLAAVIAHETGHLVLPQYSHSKSGVMAAHWRTNDFLYAKRGMIRFADGEAARMREQILSRC